MRTIVVGGDPAALDKSVGHACVVNRASRRRGRRHHWPRLWQTFVLREILAVDRLGVPVHSGSTKDPGGEPSHALD
jgi:hypothetical protein